MADTKETALFLRRYQQWRKGEIDSFYPDSTSFPLPSEITAAIDAAIAALESTQPADAALADGFQEWITDKLLILEERAIHHHRNGAYDVVKSIRNDQKMFEAIAAALRARAVPDGYSVVPTLILNRMKRAVDDAEKMATAGMHLSGAKVVVPISDIKSMLAASKEGK